MKRSLKLFIVSFIVQLIVISCTGNSLATSSDVEKKFQDVFPHTDMNSNFQLSTYNTEATFQPNSEIHLKIYNKSSYSLAFAQDSHIRLFVLINDEWEEIKNKLTYSGLLIISPQGMPLMDSSTTWVEPILDDQIIVLQRKVTSEKLQLSKFFLAV